MAAYPAYSQLEGSKKTLRDDLTTRLTPDGRLEQFGYFTETKSSFDVKHLLTTANYDAFWVFYEANRLAVCTFVWAGDRLTYNVRFADVPQEVWGQFGWQMDVALDEA